MANLQPFPALRPRPELAARICELPYDVMSSEEARRVADGNPLSFLRVSKPEIDLSPGADPYAPEVYAKGKENFERLIAQGALQTDSAPRFYLYRQVMGGHSQIGLVAAASCREYLDGAIKKHELTRPDKEDDRVRHIESLNAQTGPVFLTYRADPATDEFVAKRAAGAPDVDFTAADGVRHTSWTIGDAAGIQFIQSRFAQVPSLYIADGHHRCAAAARIYLRRRDNPHPAFGHPLPSDGRGAGGEGSAFFLAVIFPHNQLRILPYNRVLKDLNGATPARLLEKLESIFTIAPSSDGQPTRRHEIDLLLGGNRWFRLTPRPQFAASGDAIENLDVTLLQKHVLAPIFGIDDPRTSRRIHFVGGIRGAAELEKLVGSGEFACAFSMFPTGLEELMTIADRGGLMPPKSTWFEPKLRDAMFCRLL